MKAAQAALLCALFAFPTLAAEDLDPDSFQDSDEAPARTDGGIADAFVQGFKQGLRESKGKHPTSDASDLTDEDAAAVGFASLCCCFVAFIGLVVLVVFLVRRGAKAPTAAAPPPPPGTWTAAPPTTAPGAQLSVLALALDARVRGNFESSLASAGVSDSPANVAQRSQLVRTLCHAMLEARGHWRAFGYGDKSDFADDAAAETSFRAAWSDFRGRCQAPGDAGGEVFVAVLVLCTRGPVLGTSQLGDPVQAAAMLQQRLTLPPEALLAADCFFAPLDTLAETLRKFPEMVRVAA